MDITNSWLETPDANTSAYRLTIQAVQELHDGHPVLAGHGVKDLLVLNRVLTSLNRISRNHQELP
jgi:hypothetical protein